MTAKTNHRVKKSDAGDVFAPFDPNLVANPATLTNQLVAESLVYFDPAAGYVKPLTSGMGAGASAYFYGVNMDTVPANFGSVDNPTGVSPNSARNVTRVNRAAQMFLKATAGEFITPSKPIYPGSTDEQTFTVTAGGQTAIGFIDPEQAVVVAATAGQEILCRVRANYPTTPLS